MRRYFRHSGLLLTLPVILALSVPAARAQQAPGGDPPVEMFETLNALPPEIVNMILLKVNGDPILLSELRERLDGQLELLRAQLPGEEIEAQMPLIRMQMLRSMIDEMMMEHRADRLGIVVGPNEIDRYIQSVKDQNGFSTDADLEAELQRIGMTLDDLREQARKTIQQQRLVFEEVQRQVFITEGDIREYYQEHRDEFSAPQQVRLEQLVFIGDGLDAQAAAAAAELQAGADMGTVAAKYVNATAMADTGSFIAVEDLTTGLADAVPNLEPGVFSAPIATNFGLSIVKVVERTEQQVQAFEEVVDAIRNRLSTQRSQERMETYLSELRCDTRIEALDPRLDAVAATACEETGSGF
jgi:peptidyl-prolyl cis-trans isomerase SurA